MPSPVRFWGLTLCAIGQDSRVNGLALLKSTGFGDQELATSASTICMHNLFEIEREFGIWKTGRGDSFQHSPGFLFVPQRVQRPHTPIVAGQ